MRTIEAFEVGRVQYMLYDSVSLTSAEKGSRAGPMPQTQTLRHFLTRLGHGGLIEFTLVFELSALVTQ